MTAKTAQDVERDELNLDPITHAPGSHPVGTGVGSVAATAAGAAIGAAVGGPVGFAVGGAIGAVVGGAAGHGEPVSLNQPEHVLARQPLPGGAWPLHDRPVVEQPKTHSQRIVLSDHVRDAVHERRDV